MPGWVNDAWRDYARRMPRELSLELQEIPLKKRGKNADLKRLIREEGRALLAAGAPGDHRVALDGGGSPWSTERLATNLETWMGHGRDCCFLVGGPDGHDTDCLAQAQDRWSLGPLTLPHPLVRVVLAEQLYRAWTIINGHPYHRA